MKDKDYRQVVAVENSGSGRLPKGSGCHETAKIATIICVRRLLGVAAADQRLKGLGGGFRA